MQTEFRNSIKLRLKQKFHRKRQQELNSQAFVSICWVTLEHRLKHQRKPLLEQALAQQLSIFDLNSPVFLSGADFPLISYEIFSTSNHSKNLIHRI